jgi:hypothetical protein
VLADAVPRTWGDVTLRSLSSGHQVRREQITAAGAPAARLGTDR